MDRKFVLAGLTYAIIGVALGLFMAAKHDHGQLVTHAHILLVGFLVSFVYGLCHKLWLNNSTSKLAVVQFYLHQFGTAVLVVGLFLYYGRYVSLEAIDPVLALSSFAVFIGVLLMSVLFIRSPKDS